MFSSEDARFLQAFHNGTLEAFRHRDHLKLAWLVLKHHGVEEALGFVREGIKGYAQTKRATTLYHETLTEFWIRLVGHASQSSPEVSDFDQFLTMFPLLLEKSLPLRHWTPETLWSEGARKQWTDPDIKPMP